MVYENFTPFHMGTRDGCFSLEGIVACNILLTRKDPEKRKLWGEEVCRIALKIGTC